MLGGVDGEQDAERATAQRAAVRARCLGARERSARAAPRGPRAGTRVRRRAGASSVAGNSSEPARRSEVGALEVDQVQRDRSHAAQPSCFRDDLIAEQVRRDLVEHLGDVQGRRPAGELAGGPQRVALVGVGAVRCVAARGVDEVARASRSGDTRSRARRRRRPRSPRGWRRARSCSSSIAARRTRSAFCTASARRRGAAGSRAVSMKGLLSRTGTCKRDVLLQLALGRQIGDTMRVRFVSSLVSVV